jgi:hypothetical protein
MRISGEDLIEEVWRFKYGLGFRVIVLCLEKIMMSSKLV